MCICPMGDVKLKKPNKAVVVFVIIVDLIGMFYFLYRYFMKWHDIGDLGNVVVFAFLALVVFVLYFIIPKRDIRNE